MEPLSLRNRWVRALTRREFFSRAGLGLGGMAFSQLLRREVAASAPTAFPSTHPMAVKPALHFAPRAKAIIYLHMSGAPPSLDLYDFKPELQRLNMQPCPDSLLKGQRFAFIKGVPKLLASPYRFSQHGRSGGWFSETIPHIA